MRIMYIYVLDDICSDILYVTIRRRMKCRLDGEAPSLTVCLCDGIAYYYVCMHVDVHTELSHMFPHPQRRTRTRAMFAFHVCIICRELHCEPLDANVCKVTGGFLEI